MHYNIIILESCNLCITADFSDDDESVDFFKNFNLGNDDEDEG